MAGPESAKKKELVTLLANLVRHLIEGVINGQQWRHNSEVFFSVLLDNWPPEGNKKGSERYPWTKDAEKKSPLGTDRTPAKSNLTIGFDFSKKRRKKILISKLVVS